MSTKQWSEKQTKEIMKKVIRRAEVSRIARLLQHRLALANVKTQNGWENLTLDAIEPKVEENLRRKRMRAPGASPPPLVVSSFYSENDVDWVRKNMSSRGSDDAQRPSSQSSDVGPLPNFRSSKKRRRTNDFYVPSSKRQSRRDSRVVQSSPGYHYDEQSSSNMTPRGTEIKIEPFNSSPPRTPPRRMSKPINRAKHADEASGADLLLYLATSPSPAPGHLSKTRLLTPDPPRSSARQQSLLNTPGLNGPPRTPQTGFNFAEFVNITPSPAQGAFGAAGRGTPMLNATRKLNFDRTSMPPASPSDPLTKEVKAAGLGLEIEKLGS